MQSGFKKKNDNTIEFHDVVKYHECSEDEDRMYYLYSDLEELLTPVRVEVSFYNSSIVQTFYSLKNVGFCENSYNGLQFFPLVEKKTKVSFCWKTNTRTVLRVRKYICFSQQSYYKQSLDC